MSFNAQKNKKYESVNMYSEQRGMAGYTSQADNQKEIDAVDAQIAELQKEYDTADHLQKSNEYYEYMNAPDFKEYAAKGAEFENPPVINWSGGGTKNKVTYYPLRISENMGFEGYENMADDEIAIYNYLFAHDQEDGTDNSDQYLDFLKNNTVSTQDGKKRFPKKRNMHKKILLVQALGQFIWLLLLVSDMLTPVLQICWAER